MADNLAGAGEPGVDTTPATSAAAENRTPDRVDNYADMADVFAGTGDSEPPRRAALEGPGGRMLPPKHITRSSIAPMLLIPVRTTMGRTSSAEQGC